MSTFAALVDRPSTQKVVLVELDIGQLQDFWVNYRAGVWTLNINRNYSVDPIVDSSLLAGVLAQGSITQVGSVEWDNVPLASVGTLAAVLTTDSSFFWSRPNLYVHGPLGDSPSSTAVVVIGVVLGFANYARRFAGIGYEPRVEGVPRFSFDRDPVFYGKVAFGGGAVTLNNTDGEFDTAGETLDVYDNPARVRLGFDDLPISEYKTVFEGLIESLEIGTERARFDVRDKRVGLRTAAPTAQFTLATYPNLDPDNVGAVIPLAYGVIRNAPVVVVNELQVTPPSYTVKLANPIHPILAVTAVRVNGVAVTPTATNLAQAEVTLATADFSPGDEVNVDFSGYETGSALIDNALDVIVDLITNFTTILFTADFFNVTEWNATKAKAPDINLFIDDAATLLDFIEEISATVFGSFIVTGAGKFTYRIFDPLAVSSRTISRDEILQLRPVTYDPSQALTSVRVGYSRNWNSDRHKLLRDTSRETALALVLSLKREGEFRTLLVSESQAQTFATTVLDLEGAVRRIVRVTTKMQSHDLLTGDYVTVQLDRPTRPMLGLAFCEVLGVSLDLQAFEVELTLRILSLL